MAGRGGTILKWECKAGGTKGDKFGKHAVATKTLVLLQT